MSTRITLALIAALVVSSGLGAQAIPKPGATCSYDTCALRQEGGLIRRGVSGERVAKMGLFSADNVAAIVRGDSAIAYGQVFDREYRRGMRRTWIGLVMTEVPLLVFTSRVHNHTDLRGSDAALFGSAIGGVVISELGSRSLRRARTAVSKAIWWNNRELSR